jgi:hypothetical protein
MESVIESAASVPSRSELPGQVLELAQRQLELARLLAAPLDAVFGLLEESATTTRHQAEALEAAGLALTETAGLMKRQAELFEQAIGVLRQPAELARAAAPSARKPRKSGRKAAR